MDTTQKSKISRKILASVDTRPHARTHVSFTKTCNRVARSSPTRPFKSGNLCAPLEHMMKNLILATLLAATAPLLACHDNDEPNQQDAGRIQLRVDVGDQEVDTIHYVLSRGGAVVREGDADMAGAATATFRLSGVPVGDGYELVLSATTTDGLTQCLGGSTPFNITANATTLVRVGVNCTDDSTSTLGSIDVEAEFNKCPVIDTLNVSPLSTPVGGVIAFSATASDPDGATVAFAWTGDGANLSSAASFDYGCAVAGDHEVTLTITDGGCEVVDVVTVTCEP
jgi:hypothetical protein